MQEVLTWPSLRDEVVYPSARKKCAFLVTQRNDTPDEIAA